VLTDEAEAKLAHWLGVADTFIFPSVKLANIGLLPSVAPAGDLLIVDREVLGTLHDRRRQLMSGLDALGLSYHEGQAAIVSLLVGDIEKTFAAGRELFDRGYYVQSATYPAVPINAGLLRIQVNVNHSPEAVDGLLEALAAVRTKFRIRPRPQALPLPEAGLS